MNYKDVKLPESLLKLFAAYNNLDGARDKDPSLVTTLDTAFNELDIALKAKIHDAMLAAKVYTAEEHDTLPDEIWTHFASAHINRHWRMGRQPK